MFRNIVIAKFFGVPIKLHWSFFILLFLVVFRMMRDPAAGLQFFIIVVILVVSVVAHELAHTLVARKFKIRTHDILLTPIGGMARMYDVPTQPKHEILVAAAGPALSIIIALLTLPFLIISSNSIQSIEELNVVFQSIFGIGALVSAINLMLGIFNLIPAFPMDGGRILRASLVKKIGLLKATKVAATIGKFIALIFFVVGIYYNYIGLMFIGIFIFFVAGMEVRNILYREMMRQVQTMGQSQGGAQFPGNIMDMLKMFGIQVRVKPGSNQQTHPYESNEPPNESKDYYEYKGQQIYTPDEKSNNDDTNV